MAKIAATLQEDTKRTVEAVRAGDYISRFNSPTEKLLYELVLSYGNEGRSAKLLCPTGLLARVNEFCAEFANDREVAARFLRDHSDLAPLLAAKEQSTAT